MLRVYAYAPSLYCAKLRILLRHKGLEWEEIAPPGGYGSAEYRAIVPAGNLPALRDDGVLLSDSEAIAEYLNETRPEPPMLPREPSERARVRERSRYHDTRLEPAVRKMFPFIRRAVREGFDKEMLEEELADRLDGLDLLLESAPPEDWLTLGDCGFPITFTWLELLIPEMGLQVAIPARAEAYRTALGRFPAVADELSRYRPLLQNWFSRRVLDPA
ncbi:glutathione S-transferase [Nisaea acidiphila]|uniref:Glutathione S-transferase n=1 Tax=Nisaea acidiphila TaxID=1862145 RepID=A0A9J7AW57_9PROT|nr:glutathione S-transferase family protein [Nisaea acidiphila]UUX50681.1 glutathione S-transferase [Nisaea acidiphila]